MADLTFFPDPAVDRVLGVVMELAGELYALRDRLTTIELLLERQGTITRADIEEYVAGDVERAERLARRDRFVEAILAPMTYTPNSPDPPFESA